MATILLPEPVYGVSQPRSEISAYNATSLAWRLILPSTPTSTTSTAESTRAGAACSCGLAGRLRPVPHTRRSVGADGTPNPNQDCADTTTCDAPRAGTPATFVTGRVISALPT